MPSPVFTATGLSGRARAFAIRSTFFDRAFDFPDGPFGLPDSPFGLPAADDGVLKAGILEIGECYPEKASQSPP